MKDLCLKFVVGGASGCASIRDFIQVKSWLKGRGMESLSNKQDIGDSLVAAEILWQQHESLETKAQVIVTIAFYTIRRPFINRPSMRI